MQREDVMALSRVLYLFVGLFEDPQMTVVQERRCAGS